MVGKIICLNVTAYYISHLLHELLWDIQEPMGLQRHIIPELSGQSDDVEVKVVGLCYGSLSVSSDMSSTKSKTSS